MKAGQVLAILEEQSIATTLTADDPDDGAAGERADLRSTTPAGRCSMMRPGRRRCEGPRPRRRTARENLADLVDPGSFQEYGSFMYAAQKAVEMSTT